MGVGEGGCASRRTATGRDDGAIAAGGIVVAVAAPAAAEVACALPPRPTRKEDHRACSGGIGVACPC